MVVVAAGGEVDTLLIRALATATTACPTMVIAMEPHPEPCHLEHPIPRLTRSMICAPVALREAPDGLQTAVTVRHDILLTTVVPRIGGMAEITSTGRKVHQHTLTSAAVVVA